MNLAYFPNGFPQWIGDLGGGTYSYPFDGVVINPGGQQAGSGGVPFIAPGAVLCLQGYFSSPAESYHLTVSYQGTMAGVLITVD